MKRVLTLLLCGMLIFGTSTVSTYAASLDDVIAGNQQVVNQEITDTNGSTTNETVTNSDNSSTTSTSREQANKAYMDTLNAATDLTTQNETVDKVNEALSKVISIIVQILAYAITAGLTLRVVIDLAFIALPFTRAFLGNGYAGNAAVGNTGMAQGGMGNPGMGGMGMGGPGMMGGGMGMGGGMYGRGRYGGMGGGMMGGMGGMAGGMAGAPQQQASMTGRPQLVSTAALNAVAAEQMPTPDGRARNAIKIYASDMVVTLVAIPVLLILAMSGALTGLGLLLGEAIANGISALGGMI